MTLKMRERGRGGIRSTGGSTGGLNGRAQRAAPPEAISVLEKRFWYYRSDFCITGLILVRQKRFQYYRSEFGTPAAISVLQKRFLYYRQKRFQYYRNEFGTPAAISILQKRFLYYRSDFTRHTRSTAVKKVCLYGCGVRASRNVFTMLF